jgi:cytochrome c-type biogenesis protein CcmH/NrfF
VRASFINDLGLTVLMAPPAEGFNLLGYVLPGLAILMAAGFVLVFLRGSQGVVPGVAPASELSEEDEARLAEELKALDESERFEL